MPSISPLNESHRRQAVLAPRLAPGSAPGPVFPPHPAALPSPMQLMSRRALYVSVSAAAPAAGQGPNSGAAGRVPTEQAALSPASSSPSSSPAPPSSSSSSVSASAPVQNPLQAALAAVSGSQESRAVSGGRRRRQKRTWMWYDDDDEREERRNERAREQYDRVGTAYMSNITQSVKKMNRIVRLVRGLPYEDAVAQCKMVPHKAARYVLQVLEAAYQDATQAVGLTGEKLVVGIIFATRGRVEKAMQRMGRGRSGRMFTRTSHLRVVLREARERPSPAAFSMRRVAPLMSVMTGAAARWLARGPAASRRPPERFAYRVEA